MDYAGKTIEATFQRQYWDERDRTRDMGSVTFDATEQVLLRSLDVIHSLEDNTEESDDIGRACVPHAGPCYVYGLVDGIQSFFGVAELTEITQEMLDAARVQHPTRSYREETIAVTVKLKVRIAGDITTDDVIQNMNYDFTSKTEGATILDTNIDDVEVRNVTPAPGMAG